MNTTTEGSSKKRSLELLSGSEPISLTSYAIAKLVGEEFSKVTFIVRQENHRLNWDLKQSVEFSNDDQKIDVYHLDREQAISIMAKCTYKKRGQLQW